MNRPAALQELAPRLARRVIRTACRALPEAERAERELEWTVEAEAVAEDTDIRLPALRAVWFALSLLLHARATRSTRTAPVRAANRRTIEERLPSFVLGVVVATAVVVAAAATGILAGVVAATGVVAVVAVGVGVGGVVVGSVYILRSLRQRGRG